MLRNLLHREWMLNRKQYLIVLAMVVAFQVYFVLRTDSSRSWMIFTGLFMAFQVIVPFTREDKFQSAGWVCTLPVLRHEIVRARWAGAWLFVLAGFLIALAMGLMLPGSRIDPAQALAPDTLLSAAAVTSLILMLLIPFTIRFGLMGVLIFMVVAQLAGGALLVTAMMTGGRGDAGALRSLIEGTRSAAAGLQGALTPAIFQVTALVFLIVLNGIGYWMAVALYRRREF